MLRPAELPGSYRLVDLGAAGGYHSTGHFLFTPVQIGKPCRQAHAVADYVYPLALHHDRARRTGLPELPREQAGLAGVGNRLLLPDTGFDSTSTPSRLILREMPLTLNPEGKRTTQAMRMASRTALLLSILLISLLSRLD